MDPALSVPLKLGVREETLGLLNIFPESETGITTHSNPFILAASPQHDPRGRGVTSASLFATPATSELTACFHYQMRLAWEGTWRGRPRPERGFRCLGCQMAQRYDSPIYLAKETPGPKPGALGRLLARPWDGLVGLIQISAGFARRGDVMRAGSFQNLFCL